MFEAYHQHSMEMAVLMHQKKYCPYFHIFEISGGVGGFLAVSGNGGFSLFYFWRKGNVQNKGKKQR